MASLIPYTRVKDIVIQMLERNSLESLADVVRYCSMISFYPLTHSESHQYMIDSETGIEVIVRPIFSKSSRLPYVQCPDGRCFIPNPDRLSRIQKAHPWINQDILVPPSSPLLRPISNDEDAKGILDTLSLITTIDDARETQIQSILYEQGVLTKTLVLRP